ncbi:MAG: hypothetical protein JWO41_669 [Candidatus Saccharibacteria bacterium]|nr:hypothetical protein [Candidatus Saccharibacteria bacterium]
MERTPTSYPENPAPYFSAPLIAEFAKQMVDPPGGDDRIALFFQGMLDVLHGREVPPELQHEVGVHLQILNTAILDSEIVPSYAANKLLRTFQKQFMYRNTGHEYPFTTRSVEPWRSGILTVLLTPRLNEVIQDLITRQTQSNVVQRYNALKFILTSCVSPDVAHPQLLDIGCSQNLGLKKIALGGAFEDVRIVEPRSNGNTRQNRRISYKYNSLSRSPFRIGRSMGVDLYDLRDEANAEWVYACSSYPSELLNEARLEEARQLKSMDVMNVSFTQSDISAALRINTDVDGDIPERRLYDVAFASTVMYQMTKTEREKTCQLVYDRLTPEGIMVIQDFVKLDSRQLRFSGPGSDKFTYRTVVKNKQTDFDKSEEIFIWETARCTKAQLGLGQLMVAGRLLTVSDFLLPG